MPPANTPARNPSSPEPPTHQRPLTPLSYLSSPVPDLAATLHTHSNAAADDANVSFLRHSLEWLAYAENLPSQTRIDAHRDPRRVTARERGGEDLRNDNQATPTTRQHESEEVSRRERLHRVLARLNRLHEPAAPSTTAYGNRTPSPRRQTLYDWAPGQESGNGPPPEYLALLREMRDRQDNREQERDVFRTNEARQLSIQEQNDAHSTERRDRSRITAEGRLNSRWSRGPPPDYLMSLRNISNEQDRRMHALSNANQSGSRAQISRDRSIGEQAQPPQRRPQQGFRSNSPGTNNRVHRNVAERERSGLSEEEERASSGGWFRPNLGGSGVSDTNSAADSGGSWQLPPPASERMERDRQERIEATRRSRLGESISPRLLRIATPSEPSLPGSNSSSSPMNDAPQLLVESALKYLSQLRTFGGYDALLATSRHNLATLKCFECHPDDFISNLDKLPPVHPCSWIQPGAVFEGSQHAAPGGTSLMHRRLSSIAHVVEQINPNFRNTSASADQAAFTSYSDTSRHSWISSNPALPQQATREPGKAAESLSDRWPVRVVIHAVDTDSMTIQGTMEAYDVPQNPPGSSVLAAAGASSSPDRPKAGKKSAPITTYLEGHIIDLRTHSFMTPQTRGSSTNIDRLDNARIAFPSASARTDAANWRKLPPFDLLPSDDDLGCVLLSYSHISTAMNDYIFMRWKERCFVHSRGDACAGQADGDHDRGHGLTISGFYYVSLRRADGVVHGLYFDPASTPYQHLCLQGIAAGWPAVELR